MAHIHIWSTPECTFAGYVLTTSRSVLCLWDPQSNVSEGLRGVTAMICHFSLFSTSFVQATSSKASHAPFRIQFLGWSTIMDNHLY